MGGWDQPRVRRADDEPEAVGVHVEDLPSARAGIHALRLRARPEKADRSRVESAGRRRRADWTVPIGWSRRRRENVI